jgi:hypothetical protein
MTTSICTYFFKVSTAERAAKMVPNTLGIRDPIPIIVHTLDGGIQCEIPTAVQPCPVIDISVLIQRWHSLEEAGIAQRNNLLRGHNWYTVLYERYGSICDFEYRCTRI